MPADLDTDATTTEVLGRMTRPRWFAGLGPTARLGLAWIVSRALMMLLIITPAENWAHNDPFYYEEKLRALADGGIGSVMLEYPVPAVWALQLPDLLSFGSPQLYALGFVVLMAALDAGFTWLLWRASGRRRSAAIDFWLVFALVLGPLCWLRFDMLPAVLVGGALILSATHPKLAGALAAIGAATKLWPAVTWLALLPRPGRARLWTTVAFAATGVVLAGISLVQGGWDRLVSPLTWQSDRGLQIESIVATPLMVARLADPDQWPIELSQYNAFEILSGPGRESLLQVASVATAVGGLLIVALAGLLVWQLRTAAQRPGAPEVSWRIAMLALAMLLVLIVTNKTFSTQYMLWLAGPVACLLLNSGTGDRAARRRARTSSAIAWSVIGLGVATHLLYPICYPPLTTAPGQPVDPGLLLGATVVLAVRNLGLVVLTVVTVVLAVRPSTSSGVVTKGSGDGANSGVVTKGSGNPSTSSGDVRSGGTS